MRKIVISLVAASVVAQPLEAAGWQDQGFEVRRGAFIGAQFRVSLGGEARPKARAQLMIAPTQSLVSSDGKVRAAIGQGFGFGVTSGERPTLTLAGVRADLALRPQRGNAVDRGKKMGISKGVAIGLGVLAIAGGAYFLYLLSEEEKNSSQE